MRLLLALDSSPGSDAIRAILLQDGEMVIVGDIDGPDEIVPAVLRSAPDVIVIDRDLSGHDGIAAGAKVLRSQGACCPGILVISEAKHAHDVVHAARAGIRGYLIKGQESRLLAVALRAVAAGAAWLSPSAAAVLLDQFSAVAAQGEVVRSKHGLTEREQTIVRLIAKGCSNTEVAEQLSLSASTVKSHVSRVLAKLELRSRTQLALFARDHNIG